MKCFMGFMFVISGFCASADLVSLNTKSMFEEIQFLFINSPVAKVEDVINKALIGRCFSEHYDDSFGSLFLTKKSNVSSNGPAFPDETLFQTYIEINEDNPLEYDNLTLEEINSYLLPDIDPQHCENESSIKDSSLVICDFDDIRIRKDHLYTYFYIPDSGDGEMYCYYFNEISL